MLQALDSNSASASGSNTESANKTLSNAEASVYETEHVHDVYEEIASHFSATRHKPWPAVSRFLSSLPPGSVGLDVGCGNGKYFGVNPAVYIIGSDRSTELTAIACRRTASSQGAKDTDPKDAASTSADALVADGLALPHAGSRFDFAISVAVVHHFATRERRVEAVAAVLEALRIGTEVDRRPTFDPETPVTSNISTNGRALFCVWALEQRSSRRGWDRGMQQDVLVPWVMKDKNSDRQAGEQTFQRYYHLYCEGELEEDINSAGGFVLDRGYEADNWWAIAVRPPPGHG